MSFYVLYVYIYISRLHIGACAVDLKPKSRKFCKQICLRAEMNPSSNNSGHTSAAAAGDIAEDNHLVSSMTQKLELTSASASPTNRCIYRVPDNLKAGNEKTYVPQIVSIGPFHRNGENLQAMQDQKWIYLKSLLSRRQHHSSTNTMDVAFVQSLRPLEKRARESYSETFDKLNSNSFLEMMILDGCFIVELFIRHRIQMKNGHGKEVVDKDPLFTTPRLHSYLAWDLVLLENQLPLFVLEHLVSFFQLHHIKNISQEPSSFLKELALDFFQHRLVVPKACLDHHHKQQQQQQQNASNHLLDLLRNFLLGSSRPSAQVAINTAEDEQKQDRSSIPSAKDLSFADINIKKGNCYNPFNAIFKYNTTMLEIPPLSIVGDLSNPLFPNLVAFEQCCSDCSTSTEFTSYAWLMLNIIKDADGVRFLCKRGIINQLPGREKEVVLLFKKICSGVTFPRNFYFSELYDQVNEYFHSRMTMWRYRLKTEYFEDPWTAITMMNAVMVLILAIVQTFFTALPYIKKHPS